MRDPETIARETKYLDTGAQISPCGRYRFTLWRVWDETLPHIAYVGLNPSTADATEDDPTIRRCISFAKSHGFGAMTMLNLWAFRSTDPRALTGAITNEEEINADTIARVGGEVSLVCACWGANKMAAWGARRVVPLVYEWWCLRETKEGMPAHPLYLPSEVKMRRWVPKAAGEGATDASGAIARGDGEKT